MVNKNKKDEHTWKYSVKTRFYQFIIMIVNCHHLNQNIIASAIFRHLWASGRILFDTVFGEKNFYKDKVRQFSTKSFH